MNLKEICDIVYKHKPVLEEVVRKHGALSLKEYFSLSLDSSSPASFDRQQELISIIAEKTASLLGKTVADATTEQLSKNYYVSTADHFHFISHPFFCNSHLAQAISNREKGLNAVVVLGCSGISLNNSSFPRGFLFHNKNLEEKRLPFFSLKHRHHPVYALPSYKINTFPSLLAAIKKKIFGAEQDGLIGLIEEVFFRKQVVAQEFFSDQVTIVNYHFWKLLPGEQNTELIYLEQEEIVRLGILKFHLFSDTLIHHVLFDPQFHEAFEKYFDGKTGAFSNSEKSGTFLFWGIEDGERVSLIKSGNFLRSAKHLCIELTPASLQAALEKKVIFPSMALTFIVLSFYYGLRCGGGFSQVNYATELKSAYEDLLRSLGYEDKNIKLSKVDTKYFCGEFVFASLANKSLTVPATSIDLFLYGKKETSAKLQEIASHSTLIQAINPMMPEFYKIITGTFPVMSEHFQLPKPTLYV